MQCGHPYWQRLAGSLRNLSRVVAARLSGSLPLSFLILCFTGGTTSCVTGSRVVFIDSDGALIRIGPDVVGRVYWRNKDGEWELSKNKVKIPEGFFAGPMKEK